MRAIIGAAVLAVSLMAGPVLAQAVSQKEAPDLEKVMWGYLDLWNKHDAPAIIQQVYRLPDTHPWHTKEGLAAEFKRLTDDGYDHSDTSSVKGCVLTADTGQVELRFVRLKKDGSFMPPKDRVSLYQLKKFPDGWKVIGMAGLPAGGKMECPPAAK